MQMLVYKFKLSHVRFTNYLSQDILSLDGYMNTGPSEHEAGVYQFDLDVRSYLSKTVKRKIYMALAPK
jgi:hypothetical protein